MQRLGRRSGKVVVVLRSLSDDELVCIQSAAIGSARLGLDRLEGRNAREGEAGGDILGDAPATISSHRAGRRRRPFMVANKVFRAAAIHVRPRLDSGGGGGHGEL